MHHETGYPLFYDKDGKSSGQVAIGDETIVPNYSLFEDEIELVKSGVKDNPHFGGLDLTLRWKALRLSTVMSYACGAVGRLPGIYVDAEKAYYADKNMSKEFINRWKKPGDEIHTDIPVLYNYERDGLLPQRKYSTGRNLIRGKNMYDQSTIRVAKTNVLRMNSVELSYIVPTKILRNLNIESAMVSLQASNLFFVADKAWGGMDPESGYASVPTPRTYTLNLSLTF